MKRARSNFGVPFSSHQQDSEPEIPNMVTSMHKCSLSMFLRSKDTSFLAYGARFLSIYLSSVQRKKVWDRTRWKWCFLGVGEIRMWKVCQGTSPGILKSRNLQKLRIWKTSPSGDHRWNCNRKIPYATAVKSSMGLHPVVSPVSHSIWGSQNPSQNQ